MPSSPVRMSKRRSYAAAGLASCAFLALAFFSIPSGGPTSFGTAQAAATAAHAAEPLSAGGPTTLRRLSEAQYKNSIAQIFGADVKVPGRFDPPLREAGLLAIGDGKAVISASGIEQYELRAREIAAQVLSEAKRKTSLDCGPAQPNTFDRTCASTFLSRYGQQLFRRPLTAQELKPVVELAAATTVKTQSFHKGLEVGLARLLNSMNFIFRVERSVTDPTVPGGRRLDDFTLASRLSFLLWNTSPDEQLLDAAATGALRQPAEIARQVDRMIAAPAFEQGVRAFFSDMLSFNHFDGLSKDQNIYPKYTSALAKAAEEQMLRTIVDVLITRKSDYRELFVTRNTFMNRDLGSLYQIALPQEASAETWVPYTFSDSDPRAGVLTLAGFLMLDPTHEGRSSPTIRGKFVRELFLCQTVPLPPANVDFSVVQNTADAVHKTARERLTAHQENPSCAGCHKLTDPIGLSLENYDAIGTFRTRENGALIDTSGSFEGKSYNNAVELQRLLSESPAAPNCAAQRAFEYGVGRGMTPSEEKWLEYASQRFAQQQYQFPALFRLIATSQVFRTVSTAAPVLAAR